MTDGRSGVGIAGGTRTGCVAAIVALGLLACATSASAECAWVLWEETRTVAPPKNGLEWAIVAAATKAEDCGDFSSRAVADRAARWRQAGAGKVDVRGNRDDAYAGNTVFMSRYLCLPDTIDPCGGKGR